MAKEKKEEPASKQQVYTSIDINYINNPLMIMFDTPAIALIFVIIPFVAQNIYVSFFSAIMIYLIRKTYTEKLSMNTIMDSLRYMFKPSFYLFKSEGNQIKK